MKRKIPSLDRPVARRREVRADEKELWRRTLGEEEEAFPSEAALPKSDSSAALTALPPERRRTKKLRKALPEPALDAPTRTKLKRGTLAVEAILDLHGHTRDTAHGVLVRFMTQAQARGVRLALVITGKGRAGGVGTLRELLPRWLVEAPLAPMVLAYGQAHDRHGGDGAWYVRLRKHAKNAVVKPYGAVT